MKDDNSCKVDTKEAEDEVNRAQEEIIATVIPVREGASGNSVLQGSSSKKHGLIAPIALDSTVQPMQVNGHGAVLDSPTPPNTFAIGALPPPSRASFSRRSNDNDASLRDTTATTSSISGQRVAEWPCDICTLINPGSALVCDACRSPQPHRESSLGWFCGFCGAGPREMTFWSCDQCGVVRKWG